MSLLRHLAGCCASAPSRAGVLALRALRDRRGAVAMEFSIVVVPLLLLVTAIMETGFQAYTLSTLDHAVRVGSRSIQIGSAQTSGMDAETFQKSICSHLDAWVKCADVKVDVRPVPNYAALMTDQTGAKGNVLGALPALDLDGANTYCPGAGGEVVLVRVSYVTPVLFGYWLTNSATRKNTTAYILSTAYTFRTEPFMGFYQRPAGCAGFALKNGASGGAFA